MSKEKTVLEITISRLVGLIVFLVLLGVANVIQVNSSMYYQIVSFFNAEMWVIITFSILFYLGELFFVFDFPINFPAPIFNAIGGAVLVNFIFDIMVKGLDLADVNIAFMLRILEVVVLVIVVVVALIVGYVRVFSSIGGKQRRKKIKKKPVEEHDWDDVKREIKEAVYHATKNLSDKLKPEEEEEPFKKKSSKKKVSRKKTSSKKKSSRKKK
jgi:signal transduction histidine kinase